MTRIGSWQHLAPLLHYFHCPYTQNKGTQIYTPQGFQINYLRHFHALVTPLILRELLSSYVRSDTYGQTHMCQNLTHTNPKTYPKMCAEWIDIFTKPWQVVSIFTYFFLYFISWRKYHTTVYKAAYVEHNWTNAPPFTLLGNEFVWLW